MEHNDRRSAIAVLGATLLLGAVYRIYVSVTDDGIFWPDEIYQSYEPAHWLAFGYGLMPWEYLDGARSWALPGIVAAVMKVCGSRPHVYLLAVRMLFVAITVGTAYATYLLAVGLKAQRWAATAGAAALSLGALPLYFGHRAMSETAAALPVALGLWLVLREDAARRHLGWGASLLGLAVMFRLQCGLFAAGAVAVLMARRQWLKARDVVVVLGVWALLFGLLDRVTWGSWFHSAFKYLDFNLVKGGGAAWGTHPWSHLLLHLFASMTGLSLAFAAALLVCLRHARGLALIALAFFALHSVVPHKEIRFILPVLPLFGACLGVALSHVPRALTAALLLVATVSAWKARELTWGDLGAYPERAAQTAWDDFGPFNRLLLKAHEQNPVCGVFIEGAHLAWVGGHTYLHHRVGLYMGGMQPPPGAVNYVVTPREFGEVVARDGPLRLVRVSTEACQPDPGYSWRLP